MGFTAKGRELIFGVKPILLDLSRLLLFVKIVNNTIDYQIIILSLEVEITLDTPNK